MLKKLRSRRGFTIVEVMVAFVIFAIMAGMVGTILSTTMRAKQENIDVEEEIAAQKQAYYQKQQPMSKDDYTSNPLMPATIPERSALIFRRPPEVLEM